MSDDQDEEFGRHLPPAGFIPPEFREFVYEPLSAEQLDTIRMTTGVWKDGAFRRLTDDEIRNQFRSVAGVCDTRTGQVDRQISGVPFFSVESGDGDG